MKPVQETFDFTKAPTGPAVKPPFSPLEASRLAARGVYCGTSSWKYRGWEGLIYRGGYESEAQFQRQSLREYTAVLPCVGVDFTYFAWPVDEMMAYLVESTPDNFRLLPKVTKRITMSTFPNLPAYGKWAGQANPEFLSVKLFEEKFLAPLRRLEGRIGLVQFEFTGPEESELPRLEEFFSKISRDFPYAVELRNPALVTPAFYELLRRHRLSPAFSSWTRMPPVGEQFSAYLAAGGDADTLPLLGLGIVRPGRSYDEAVRLFQPYSEIREGYEEGRAQLAGLGEWAMKHQRKAYLLVNNRLEGSAPHTIGGILDRLTPGSSR
jgi:uncharacterized protein YecE (DUF72 family)